MKLYISVTLGIVALIIIVSGGYMYAKKYNAANAESSKTALHMKTITGKVVRVYEGDNMLEYSFNIPDTATTSIEMDGALINVFDASSTPLATLYISYEGARGYTPMQYFSQIIAPHIVTAVTPNGTTTVGAYAWHVTETPASEWHIASTANDQWLVVTQNKKAVHDVGLQILESFKAN